jgi:hypothetical protein
MGSGIQSTDISHGLQSGRFIGNGKYNESGAVDVRSLEDGRMRGIAVDARHTASAQCSDDVRIGLYNHVR